ncbi:MAG: EH signature domain-containing protein [Porticoccaceae bacterium]|nr:EH signature domain-containing protein [Porticoccaceae bacterium]
MWFQSPGRQKPEKMMRLAENVLGVSVGLGGQTTPFKFPQRSIDELVKVILDGRSEELSLLDWDSVLQKKQAWDVTHEESLVIKSTAVIFDAAISNQYLKQLIFFRVAIQLDSSGYDLPELLVKHLEMLAEHVEGHWATMLKTVLYARDKNFEKIAGLCLLNDLTPEEFFAELSLPTCTVLKQRTEFIVPFALEKEASPVTAIKWFLHLCGSGQLNLESLVNGLLLNPALTAPPLRATDSSYRKLSMWLDENCNPANTDSLWPRLSEASRTVLSEWIDVANYGRIRRVAQAMITLADALQLEEYEVRNLGARSSFWANYSDSMLHVNVYLPYSTIDVLLRNHKVIGIDPNRIAALEPADLYGDDRELELVVIEFERYIFVELLRGGNGVLRCFENTITNRRSLIESSLSMRRLLEMPVFDRHDHVTGWQQSMEYWLRKTLTISPNSGTKKFIGLSKERGTYDVLNGLPQLTAEAADERERKLKGWQRTVIEEQRRYGGSVVGDRKQLG